MKSTTRHLFGQRCLIGFIVLGITVLIAGQRHRTTAQAISQTPSAALSAPQGKEPQRPTLRGSAAIEQLKKDGQYDSLQAAMKQARYTVQRAEVTPLGRAAWHAPNPAHGYDAYVTEEGVSIALAQDSYVSLTLRGVGYGEGLQYVGAGTVSGEQHNLTITRDGKLTEWYVNGAGGLEQGFTLTEARSANATDSNCGWQCRSARAGAL